MDHTAPPLFKQGPSALARVVFFSAMAIALLVADARFHALNGIRQVVGTVLYPIQRAALAPGAWLSSASEYFGSVHRIDAQNQALQRERVQLSQNAMTARQLEAENAQLRRLLGVREHQPVKSIAAEVMYDARDPFSRKVIVDRGTTDGISAGQPVIDDAGIIGQVTRVFPFNSEVTLLTDRDHAIPVQILRSGLRAVAYGEPSGGTGGGALELRFMAANADVRQGDDLVTSGIDGVYPAGLPVARVERVERTAAYAFARISCTPVAGVDRNRHVLILQTAKVAPPPPQEEPADPHPRSKRGSAGLGSVEPVSPDPRKN